MALSTDPDKIFSQLHWRALALTPNQKFLFTADANGTLKKFSLPRKLLIQTIKISTNTAAQITAMAISQNSKFISIGVNLGNLKILNVKTLHLLRTKKFDAPILALSTL
jgi:WD40 repeat protein